MAEGERGRSGDKAVLQFRLDLTVYEELKRTAKKKRLTISQEAARRIELMPHYEEGRATAAAFLEEAKKVTAANIPQHLRQFDFTPIRTAAGTFWAEPGVPSDAVPKPSLDPDAIAAIEKAVEKAVEKVLGERNEPRQHHQARRA